MWSLLVCRRRQQGHKSEMLEWNAASSEVLLEAERGEPPASRALCPVCRHPLFFEQGAWLAGTATCARSGDDVDLTAPHFRCGCEDCAEVVALEEGPGAFIDPEYDVYDEQTHRVNVEQMVNGAGGHVHSRLNKGRRRRSIAVAPAQAQPKGADAVVVAQRVLEAARLLGEQVRNEECDELDSTWNAGEAFDDITFEDALALLVAAERVLASQPTLVEAPAPCKVVGDLHGQLRDVLLFFNIYGWPDELGTHWVFNGDYVDRGAHQVEVALLVLALKVLSPTRVWLLRGNHEEETVNRRYGFDRACARFFGDSYGAQAFFHFQEAFNQLPLACLIGGKILSLHGGVGNGHWKLDDLRQKQRPLRGSLVHEDDFVYNILWSDPIEDDDPGEKNTSGLHTSPRSKKTVKFGWNVTIDFCRINNLEMVIRSHQFKKAGYGFDVMHENMLVRVFTARDYEGHQDNDGAIVQITPEGDTGLLRVRPQVLRSVARG